MLAERIEDVASSGLDHDRQAELVQPSADLGDPAGQVRPERVQVKVVEGQRDPVVAQRGQETQRVLEPVAVQPLVP